MSTNSQALMVGCIHMVQNCTELHHVAVKESWWTGERVLDVSVSVWNDKNTEKCRKDGGGKEQELEITG